VSRLLEQALEKVGTLPEDEQNLVAAQILALIADEQAWKEQLATKRDVIRRMAREAIDEDAAGQTQVLAEHERRESLRVLLRDLIEQHGEPTAKDVKWTERALAPRRRG